MMVGSAQVLIALIPLIGVIVFGVLAFFFMLWDHQKQMLLIERGERARPRNFNEKLLLLGIVSFFIGIGLSIFFTLQSGLSDSLLGGIIPVMTGLGIIVYYIVIVRRGD
jgi:hypothetical protein